MLRALAYAFLVSEAHFDDLELIVGELPHEREELCQILCLLLVRLLKLDGWLDLPFAREPLGAVGDGVRGDTVQPGRERCAPPLERPHIRERVMEHLPGPGLRFP